MPKWTTRQFGRIVDDFKAECPNSAWSDLLVRYAILKQLGPACGPSIAKKLKGGDGIWELVGHADNHQPRLLFYFDGRLIVFVNAFMKKGSQNYKPAIRLAQQRRSLIQRGLKVPNELNSQSTIH